MKKIHNDSARWLVFFYSVPSKPVKNRMSVWRRLMRAGAVQLKGTVYILPYSTEHEEFLHWLVEDIVSMGGEGAFLRTDNVEPMGEQGIMALFDEARTKEYQALEREFSVLERKLDSMKKGGTKKDITSLLARHSRLSSNLDELLKTDFFNSPKGKLLKDQSTKTRRKLDLLDTEAGSERQEPIKGRRIIDYKGRVWATRKNPFVDRMASAWLIRRFIDPKAEFIFVDEAGQEENSVNVLFDIKGGEFTHVGDLCTIEVMVRAFGLKDKATRNIAEIVHEVDVKDDKYRNPEAAGLEQILSGLRKATKDDSDLLEKGISVFEMLYLSKAR